MEKNQGIAEVLTRDEEALTAEEQVWFPNILRYWQNRGVGDGKSGQLQRGRLVIIENFLPEAELAALLEYTLEHEADFHQSEVIHREEDKLSNTVKSIIRQSLILTKIEQQYKDMITRQMYNALPNVLNELGMLPFPIEKIEYQLTASNDGEFFKIHSDASDIEGPARNRYLTYVYYFYREPKPFTGGDLHVYDTIVVEKNKMAALNFQTITPRQNRIVFFPSVLQHEVLQVHCLSQQFADSRFTFNGWLHLNPEESK